MKIEKILPKYAWKAYFGLFLYNFIVFYGTRLYNRSMHHICMESSLDRAIPFVESAIVIYVLAFVQWIVCFTVIMRESRELCREFAWSWFVGETICLMCFSFLPTQMPRPTAEGGGVFSWMINIVFSADSPDNLFPSIHCMYSWFCLRYAARCRKMRQSYVVVTWTFAILVMASTLFVKQHVIADVFSGIAAAELAMLAGKFIIKNRNVKQKEKELF